MTPKEILDYFTAKSKETPHPFSFVDLAHWTHALMQEKEMELKLRIVDDTHQCTTLGSACIVCLAKFHAWQQYKEKLEFLSKTNPTHES